MTTKVTGVEWFRLVAAPVMVNGYVPTGNALVMFSVEEPDPPLTVAGVKLAVACAGNPLTVSVTLPV